MPRAVAVDPLANVLVAELENSSVRRFDTNGGVWVVVGRGYGGPATNAILDNPKAVALDADGNMFIADSGNNRVRKVTADGNISTVAGSGTPGFSGDGGAATNATLTSPAGIALDAFGNLLIADSGNNRIRSVNSTGTIYTFAGTGIAGYSGDGGAASNAALRSPAAITLDRFGNVFIADSGNNRIRRVATNGNIVTFAGNGVAGYSGDGGAATRASLKAPASVAVDSLGNAFIADSGNGRIRKVDPTGNISTVTSAGFGNMIPAVGLALDAFRRLFIADGFVRILSISTDGTGARFAGGGIQGYSGDGGAAVDARLNAPVSVALDGSGNLFIVDSGNNRIRLVTKTQGATLTLSSVNASNSGNYRVLVASPSGIATSSIAALTVTSSPLIYRTAQQTNGSLTLYCVTQPNSSSELLRATNLTPPVFWQSLSTNVPGLDGDWYYSDSNMTVWPQLFYRSVTR